MDNELRHHGILGQKWGVRRYQNEDGSLTPAGQKRYYSSGGYRKYGKDSIKDLNQYSRNIVNFKDDMDRALKKAPSDKTDDIIKTFETRISETRAKIDGILKDLNDKGYTVDSKEITWATDRALKNQMIAQIIAGPIAGIPVAVFSKKYKENMYKLK